MSFVSTKHTFWEPNKDGDIQQVTRADEGWRSVMTWRSALQDLTPTQLQTVCSLMSKAYAVGRAEQAEDTRDLLGIRQR